MRLKGIIFDGDGVLFDTEKLHVIAWEKVFKDYNIKLNKDDFKEGIGVEDKTFLKKLTEKGKIEKALNLEKLVFEKNMELIKIVEKENIKVSDKIREVLEFLKKRYKIAIASNSDKKFILKVLELSNIYNFFDSIVTRNDVKRPKPFPDIYIEVIRNLKIPVENIIAFEDSETGILSAKSSGIFCIGIPTTQPFEKIKIADIIVNELNLNNVKKIIKIFEEKNEN
ncbi:MAG: HAD family phosphatase [Candidatus Omnitrophica bacterium]|nr:HAD family phosphatase [Candidatus Omnitrophota bacterium]MCM8808769.1 HAD family phosphatase [Candidatus Omnitrophota bacterium]